MTTQRRIKGTLLRELYFLAAEGFLFRLWWLAREGEGFAQSWLVTKHDVLRLLRAAADASGVEYEPIKVTYTGLYLKRATSAAMRALVAYVRDFDSPQTMAVAMTQPDGMTRVWRVLAHLNAQGKGN